MESILTALRDLSVKDLFPLLFSFAAFIISLIGIRRGSIERDRVFRSTLTDVLNKMMEANIEFTKLQHEHASDPNYLNSIASVFSQRNGFFLEQATYIASRIPSLVRTYEWNTLATAHASQGNFAEADELCKKAIQIAPNATQRGQATRVYAYFLYTQARVPEARDAFKKAIDTFKKEDNSDYYNQGLAYQFWGYCEREFNRSPETAEEYFNNAREKFKKIDMKLWKEKALSDLNAALGTTAGPQPSPNVPGTAAQPSFTAVQSTNISQP